MNARCPWIRRGASRGVSLGVVRGGAGARMSGGRCELDVGLDVNPMWDRGTSCPFPFNLLYPNFKVVFPCIAIYGDLTICVFPQGHW